MSVFFTVTNICLLLEQTMSVGLKSNINACSDDTHCFVATPGINIYFPLTDNCMLPSQTCWLTENL